MFLVWLNEFWWIFFFSVGFIVSSKAAATATAQQSISFNPIMTLNSPESIIRPRIEQGGITAIPTTTQKDDLRVRAAVAFNSPNARVDAGGNDATLPLNSNQDGGFLGPDETALSSEVGAKGFLGGLGFEEGEFPLIPLVLLVGGGAILFIVLKK